MAHAQRQQQGAEGQQHAHVEGQQHPIGIYLKIWGLLFVLSAASYLVDYFHFQGYLRWFLIIVAIKVLRGDLDHQRPGFLTGRKGNYEIVETMGLYWHFVDLVWVFIFALFYLW